MRSPKVYLVLLVTLMMSVVSASAYAAAGTNCYSVPVGVYNFVSNTTIPADFFWPGSDPFVGSVCLVGSGLGPNDVVVERLDPLSLPTCSSSDVIPIEMVRLDLESCQPITVTQNGGQNPEEWDVVVDLSTVFPPVGTLTAIKTHCNGGTYTSTLHVQPKFTFTRVSNPSDVRVFDMGLEGISPEQLNEVVPYSWQDTSPVEPPPCDGNEFYPVGAEPFVMQSAGKKLVLELLPLQKEKEDVLFVSDRDEPGNWDIYIMNVNDTSGPGGLPAVRRLTTDPAIDNHPELSPDGTKVVWSSTRDPGTNPEGDFEIFIADYSPVKTLEVGNVTQLTKNDYPDRHPHFNHNLNNLKIIHSAKFICVQTEDTVVSECSIPREVIINPCGRKCEGIKIMDAKDLNGDNVGDNLIEIDHDVLSAIDSLLWPPRDINDARWVGHPSFSPDDSMIVFSGAVDGQGRNWEIYTLGWNGTSVSNLRQITLESTYPDNPNPIKMTGGAHFSEDDSEILFTSTRTEFGNSQLFTLPSSADKVPVSPAIRHPLSLDKANVYVPEPLEDGRIVLVSDLEEFTGLLSCRPDCEPLIEYSVAVDSSESHTIRIVAPGMPSPGNPGGETRIHLDAYKLNLVLFEESEGTTYNGSWSFPTSPTASMGYYAVTAQPNDYVDIAVPLGTSTVTLHLGQTPRSGIAQILLDGMPITNGDVSLPGDADPDKSGVDLYTPLLVTSNDLDLVIISADGNSITNLTDNDLADEMLLIGDEVSWFCGLSPNLSECTYLPKYLTIGQLWLMAQSEALLPQNFPSRCLYQIAWYNDNGTGLYQFMSGDNNLRPFNQNYWWTIMEKMWDHERRFDNELVVLPTPVNFCVRNEAPSEPSYPFAYVDFVSDNVQLNAAPSTDPDGDSITYDIYLGRENGPLLIVASDLSFYAPNAPTVTLPLTDLAHGSYSWRVVAKDCRGGLKYGPIWTFCNPITPADLNCDNKVTWPDFAIVGRQWRQTGSLSADINRDGKVDWKDTLMWAQDWLFGVFEFD